MSGTMRWKSQVMIHYKPINRFILFSLVIFREGPEKYNRKGWTCQKKIFQKFLFTSAGHKKNFHIKLDNRKRRLVALSY